MEEETIEASETRKNSEASSPRNIFKKRVVGTQTTINNMFKKGMREEACQAIARFFYNNAIPFNVAKSEEFIAMLDLVSRHGLGFKPSSYHEIRVKYLTTTFVLSVLEKPLAFFHLLACEFLIISFRVVGEYVLKAHEANKSHHRNLSS